ncbi:squalene/phytoene synthase family protein [Robiginitomaculum antarcticum]|uniref:squalene/phytoene synthase family protein n=1 Tax=Robiginitomaculum antarcticum TaxID=437507 RepID=UPI0003618CE4|nr:squalene/phytoene synthase family protein [Robiginitomaculum antarcticum]
MSREKTISAPPSAVDALAVHDPDRRRAALFAPKGVRDDLLTLYAFHYELAKIPELVSEPMVGAIRYQWWRDAVEEIYGGGNVRSHEVSTPLAQMVRRRNLPRFGLDKLIDARMGDLEAEPFADIAAARDYAAQTSGRLMTLAARIASPDENMDFARLLGRSWGMAGLVRAYGYYHKAMLLNLDYGDLRAAALEDYKVAKASAGKVSADLIPAIAYAGLVPKFIAKSGGDFDPLTTGLTLGPLAKQLRLMGVVITGRV